MREHHLDGLRGWASLFVVFGHLGPMFLLAGRQFPALPFLWDGQLAVYVFFVLSGYVLSVGHFRRGARSAAVLQAIRRYPRLTVPILASCAIAVALQQFGLLHNIAAGVLVKSPWLESFYSFEMTWPGLLQFAGWDVYARYEGTHTYNAVLWTMPFEMLGSLLIFGMLFLVGSNRTLQVIATAVFIAWTGFTGSPLLAFALGTAVALASATAQSSGVRPPHQMLGWLLLGVTLTVSLYRYLGGGPVQLSLYAAAILIAVQITPALQRILSNRLSQWLGAVSFPLYLTHLLVFCSVSSYMVLALSENGSLSTTVRLVIAITTIAASLIVATAFEPIEKLAIRVSRAISSAAMCLASASRRASPVNATPKP
ncbi:acyltransferase family protein [Achromobacter mucicolens]|uniref:acyltransferase family protein n=1 Tax=Achromobacter mucicolens TaxID=1389922 RepID=UPI00076B4994